VGTEKMDQKQQQLVRDLHDRIYNGATFTETDVVSLLILVREEAGTHVRELADFVAHRERDRGLLWQFPEAFDRIANLPESERPGAVDLPLQIQDLRREFNAVFKSIGLNELAHAHVEYITLLAASVLDGVTFTMPRKPPPNQPIYPLKSLVFGFDAEFVGLCGDGVFPSGPIRFPLFGVYNRFKEVFNAPALPWFPRSGYVAEVSLRGGSLHLEEKSCAARIYERL
jgi:hypothetical protein